MGAQMSSPRAAVFLALVLSLAFVLTEGRKPRRSARDWEKLVDNEVDKMYKEEEDARMSNQPAMPSLDPENLKQPGAVEKLMASQKAGKPAMVFVTVNTKNRAETDDFAGKSRALLKEANGVDAQAYVIEDDKLLFSIQDGSQGYKLKEILL